MQERNDLEKCVIFDRQAGRELGGVTVGGKTTQDSFRKQHSELSEDVFSSFTCWSPDTQGRN